MEINQALIDLCKSDDITNIQLAYITAVESGLMSFMEFLLLLFLVRECNKTGNFNIRLYNSNYKLPVASRRPNQLLYCFDLTFTNNGNDVKLIYSYNLPSDYTTTRRHYDNRNARYDISKISLNKSVSNLFTEESLQGNKKGVIKFFMFLNVLEFIEKNINQYHSDFKLLIGHAI